MSTIRRRCSLCSKEACSLVADKLGFMKVGALCYGHYIRWSTNDAMFVNLENSRSCWMVFQRLPGFSVQEKAAGKDMTRPPRDRDVDLGDSLGVIPLKEVEKQAILDAMMELGGNVQLAAKWLRISTKTLYSKLAEYEWKHKKPKQSLPGSIPDMEKKVIMETLVELNWNITEACKELGVGRATLYRKLRIYGFKRVSYFDKQESAGSTK